MFRGPVVILSSRKFNRGSVVCRLVKPTRHRYTARSDEGLVSFCPSLTFSDQPAEASPSAASQRSRETPRDRLSKDVARATETRVQVSIGHQFTNYTQLVNGQHIAEASIDSPRWRVATVPSCSSGPSDRQEEETLLPFERLGDRGLGSYEPFTTRNILRPDQSQLTVTQHAFFHAYAQKAPWLTSTCRVRTICTPD
jgi:hypothetical protein